MSSRPLLLRREGATFLRKAAAHLALGTVILVTSLLVGAGFALVLTDAIQF